VANELQVAVDAAREAAIAVLQVYRRPDFKSEEKADGKGPVTEADLLANDILIAHLRRAFPDDAILSEESVDDPARVKNRRCWVIDPLDGTREFTERVPQFVVSVGLAVDGKPAVGVLLNPVTGELFTGVVGVGATYNERSCTVTHKAELPGARLLVSATEHRKGWFEHLEGVAELEPVGSVAYKLGLVAAGRADATFTPRPRNEWDLLGGTACIIAAGGRATDGLGVDYTFNRLDPLHIGVAGTNGAIHEAIMDLVRAKS
jgi:myo-inositol-1(or 4)-monophosphatase